MLVLKLIFLDAFLRPLVKDTAFPKLLLLPSSGGTVQSNQMGPLDEASLNPQNT
jgi:hypothetical protein